MQTLQRIVGGEEGVSARQSAGERRVSEIRWGGVFCAVTPPPEKHKIPSDLPAASWRRITRSIWPEANVEKMAATRDPTEYKKFCPGTSGGSSLNNSFKTPVKCKRFFKTRGLWCF